MDKSFLLKQTGLFDKIDESVLNEIVAASEEINFATNEIIIHEGELGDAFFIMESGSVRVFTKDPDGNEIVLARLEAKNYFGEQALLEKIAKPRNATVRAISEVKLLKISQKTLHELLHLDEDLHPILTSIGEKQLLEKFSQQLSELASIKDDLLNLADQHIQEFDDQQTIFNEGDIPDNVYVIIKGQVSIKITTLILHHAENVILSEGNIFGEFGVLQNKPRSGTAKAIGNLKVLSIPADKFRELYSNNTALSNFISALYHIYQIPTRGLVKQYRGKFEDMDAICSIFKLQNDEIVTAWRVIDKNLFSITHQKITDVRKLRYEQDDKTWREVLISDDKLVGVTSFGVWEDLGTVSAMVLNKASINNQREKAFLQSGMFSEVAVSSSAAADDQVICECMSVTRETINQAIKEGETEVDQISETTGAGSVCGSCRQKIEDMLGRAIWYPATLMQTQEHNLGARSYLLKAINCKFKIPKPGQYVIVQAEINRNWIERAYTITSLPNEDSYEITIKCESLGLFSQWLFHQNNSIPLVRVSPPMGEFLFDTKSASPAVCFAGGIGITPILAFMRVMKEENSKRRLHIEYCVIDNANRVFRDELQKLVDELPNISLHIRMTDTAGLITAKEIENLVSTFEKPEIYICGPEGFEKEVIQGAKLCKIETSRIHTEQFVHAGGPLQMT